MFLLTDSQIKEESFLEDVDSLLNTGEVPNLFAVDEKAELIEVMCYRIREYVILKLLGTFYKEIFLSALFFFPRLSVQLLWLRLMTEMQSFRRWRCLISS